MKLVVVESPTKAKTINKYLGSGYKVIASYGHVRDLSAKAGSVLPEEDFSMSWTVDKKSKSRLTDITTLAKKADSLILATDPDREGEAISWHVVQVLNEKKILKDKTVERVVFNAITKRSVLEAMERPRQVNKPLVNAYLARRALDYLFGFTLSPILWHKLPGSRSAGRVQSVALRLICEREEERESFQPEEYWSILGKFKNSNQDLFDAHLVNLNGEKLQPIGIKSEEQARDIKDMLISAHFKIQSVEARLRKRNPYPPFTTSTLQQEASKILGFSASRTMHIAQKLYEGIDLGNESVGLITYMRTDSVRIVPESINEIRKIISELFGTMYLPEKARLYSSKSKYTQESHEAIRPTSLDRIPKELASILDDDQAKLYELIWNRTVSSQMASAKIEQTRAEIKAISNRRVASLRAVGSVIQFNGFLCLYNDFLKLEKNSDKPLVPLIKGEKISLEKIEATQHFTESPARYSESTLIRKLEELGIGRPSTYASTLVTLREREYIIADKRKLVPQTKGRLVTSFLESFFKRYVGYSFTAELEERLDKISTGALEWKDVLRDFWQDFSNHVYETKDLRITEVLDTLNETLAPFIFPQKKDGSAPRICPTCTKGQLSLKIGKFGAFIGCSTYPDCKFTRQLGLGSENPEQTDLASNRLKVLGLDPTTKEKITFRTGRYGPYVQRGEGKQAKRSRIPQLSSFSEIDFEKALCLLDLPRLVGKHPKTGKDIITGLGRYGPFILHEGKYASLEKEDEVFTIDLNHAVIILAESKGRVKGKMKS
ncbi:type I DNA topoisomerase [Candidatus Endowatersipora endosymbiont of Watersipora subatra]|uniref:type I DNA topoisomerase n=1 Tax=Candidatus Endowatersipora endosymbiont of Watersipora subatra TaxID=3077946 RepID=UPI00312C8C10